MVLDEWKEETVVQLYDKKKEEKIRKNEFALNLL